MPSEPSGRPCNGYNRVLFSSVLLLSAATALFCVAVDPYGIFGAPTINHLTAVKSAAAARLRLSKAFAVDRVQPETVVTGSSITNLGINPEDPGWAAEDRPVFNLGIDGAKIELQRRFLLHALAANHPRRVVILTSFEDYAPDAPDGSDDAGSLPALRVGADDRPEHGYALARTKDLVSATLSLRALSDSFNTLLHQSGALLRYQTPLGFEVHGPEQQYSDLHGIDAALTKTEVEFAATLLRWRQDPRWSTRSLTDMIRSARAAGAAVVVVIPPIHPNLVELRRQLGLQLRVEAWRAEVAGAVTAQPGTTLWDFGSLPIAAADQRAADESLGGRFWDAVHFTPALGRLLIGRIETDAGPADFGERIDAGSLVGPDATQQRFQQDWTKSHPADVARIADLIAEVERTLCAAPQGCAKSLVSRSPETIEAVR